jgi:hypothetical protein
LLFFNFLSSSIKMSKDFPLLLIDNALLIRENSSSERIPWFFNSITLSKNSLILIFDLFLNFTKSSSSSLSNF